MRSSEDHYAVLGIAPAADLREVRRAYHRLARQHHPDVAGTSSAAAFAKIAEAYRVLSDPGARAAYDHRRRANETSRAASAAPRERGAGAFSQGPMFHWRVVRAPENPIARLCDTLDALVSRGAARRAENGIVELWLSEAEAAVGGTALVEMKTQVACPTCLGVAERNRMWCCRCQFEGRVEDTVVISIPIRPRIVDGAAFRVPVDPHGGAPPLLVRVRISPQPRQAASHS